MLNAPYVKQPDPKSCAMACYTMVAKYFFPEATLDQIATISDWKPGYTIWAFKFWIWVMDKGIKITEYDSIDYEAWADKGLESLRESVSEKEFKYYIENSLDLGSHSQDIIKILKHPNFIFIKQKPTFELLEKAIKSGKICEVVLDARTLKEKEGFSLHRIVVLEINDTEVIFHDPADRTHSKAKRKLFVKAWLKAVTEPELCIYEKS